MPEVRLLAEYLDVVQVALVGRHESVVREDQLDLRKVTLESTVRRVKKAVYFLKFRHSDDPSAVQRHLVLQRQVDRLLADVVASEDPVQAAHLEPARALRPARLYDETFKRE